MDVSISLPQEFVVFEGVSKVQQEIKISYALWLFRHHRVTIAKAADLASMSIYEFMQRCHEEQIAVIDLDKESLLAELL
jgi:predicted HTH domain antitoxin